mgnify:CR=1 FL=1
MTCAGLCACLCVAVVAAVSLLVVGRGRASIDASTRPFVVGAVGAFDAAFFPLSAAATWRRAVRALALVLEHAPCVWPAGAARRRARGVCPLLQTGAARGVFRDFCLLFCFSGWPCVARCAAAAVVVAGRRSALRGVCAVQKPLFVRCCACAAFLFDVESCGFVCCGVGNARRRSCLLSRWPAQRALICFASLRFLVIGACARASSALVAGFLRRTPLIDVRACATPRSLREQRDRGSVLHCVAVSLDLSQMAARFRLRFVFGGDAM